MKELSKAAKKQLRHLAAVAYERELANELTQLEKHFASWHDGEIDGLELNDLVHRFHDGPSRKLFTQYTDGVLEWLAASAIMRGIVSEEEAGPETLTAIERHLGFLREQAEK